MGTIVQVATPAEIQQVQELIREFTSWAFASIEGSDQAPTFHGLEEELATLPGVYAPPTGCLLLALQDGKPAGCVALKAHDSTSGELKRLYVRPGFRGGNLGQQLVTALVDIARNLGYRRIVLDSHISMTKAHAIYRSAGFRDVHAPDDFPDELKSVVVFMELAVDA
jgi:ribosomal protein S18 acetylase RimI-like enzyme